VSLSDRERKTVNRAKGETDEKIEHEKRTRSGKVTTGTR
jgi:hypothetical protein